jgi:hypothetical protein
MFVKAAGPSGRAKIRSDGPKHALGLAQYLRAIGYNAWIEDTNGDAIDEKALKPAAIARAAWQSPPQSVVVLRVDNLARDRRPIPPP